MASTFNFLPQSQILESSFSGVITILDLLEHEQNIQRYAVDYPIFRNLIDTSSCDISMDVEELKTTETSLVCTSSRFEFLYQAIIMTNPDGAALGLVYEHISAKITNYKFKVFSTREAAILWLNSFEVPSVSTHYGTL